jgi:hypothetical protein
MNTERFIKNYFDIAMKIHAICSDNSISKDDAKLYVYIYVKTCESAEGIDYFEQDCTIEIEALKSLLGSDYNQNATVFEEPVTPQMLVELYQSFVKKAITKIERDIQLEYGLERVIRSELADRLRLHVDPSFRSRHIDIFKNLIYPEIGNYDETKVRFSNVNYQIKLARKDREIDILLGN